MKSLSLEQTNQFSNLFLDYLKGDEKLVGFYGLQPNPENFKKQIAAKKFEKSNRDILVSVLQNQYKGILLNQLQSDNLQKLSLPTTFTITTGHQLSLATGPLYFIYKILTAIRLAEELNVEYKENHFVPLFWMATEDHDIEEINHFYLFGKKAEWKMDQKGAAGKLSNEGLKELFAQFPDIPLWLKDAYCNSASLAEATRTVAQVLFAEYGLLVLDGDDKALKNLLSSVIQKDLLDNKYSPLVRETSEKLLSSGYKAQAFVRDQNFFYLSNQSRERIEKKEGNYLILNTSKSFSEQEIKNEIQENPEKFSPNVILRPLYQETILPNLAYIGGPGELAYWLQLKSVFDAEEIPFPILFPRKFITIVSSQLIEKLNLAGLTIDELFLSEPDFFDLLLEKLKIEKFDFGTEESLLNEIKTLLLEKATKADKSFFPAIEAEISKAGKGISDLGKRLNKALENRHETDLAKHQNLRKKLFPNNELQERHDNFLNFYINNPKFLQVLHKNSDPFDFKMELIRL